MLMEFAYVALLLVCYLGTGSTDWKVYCESISVESGPCSRHSSAHRARCFTEWAVLMRQERCPGRAMLQPF